MTTENSFPPLTFKYLLRDFLQITNGKLFPLMKIFVHMLVDQLSGNQQRKFLRDFSWESTRLRKDKQFKRLCVEITVSMITNKKKRKYILRLPLPFFSLILTMKAILEWNRMMEGDIRNYLWGWKVWKKTGKTPFCNRTL